GQVALELLERAAGVADVAGGGVERELRARELTRDAAGGVQAADADAGRRAQAHEHRRGGAGVDGEAGVDAATRGIDGAGGGDGRSSRSTSAEASPCATLPDAGWSVSLPSSKCILALPWVSLMPSRLASISWTSPSMTGCENGPTMVMRARGSPDSHVDSGAGRSASGPRPWSMSSVSLTPGCSE